MKCAAFREFTPLLGKCQRKLKDSKRAVYCPFSVGRPMRAQRVAVRRSFEDPGRVHFAPKEEKISAAHIVFTLSNFLTKVPPTCAIFF